MDEVFSRPMITSISWYLDVDEILSCTRVSKSWYDWFNSEDVWYVVFKKWFGNMDVQRKTWKEVFISERLKQRRTMIGYQTRRHDILLSIPPYLRQEYIEEGQEEEQEEEPIINTHTNKFNRKKKVSKKKVIKK